MNVTKLITRRSLPNRFFMDIVYEWEDVFAKAFPLSFRNDYIFDDRKIFGAMSSFISRIYLGNNNYLKFDINTVSSTRFNLQNVIPIIIDFYDRVEDFPQFYERYNNHKIVFVSSYQAYSLLKEHNCPFRIEHLPLSLSDKYKLSESDRFEKTHDLVILGRQNSVFAEWIERYKKCHPDFSYIYSKWERKHPWVRGSRKYYSSEGEEIGYLDSREDYIKWLKRTRVALYSTPSMDQNPNSFRHGYNQVTPRFLEFLACGCNVLCRYESNPDTKWYKLDDYWPNIETYEQFEIAMDTARSKEPDMKFYADYLSKHYTSCRVQLFKEILSHI